MYKKLFAVDRRTDVSLYEGPLGRPRELTERQDDPLNSLGELNVRNNDFGTSSPDRFE
jgi:hypothetical protein